jgi:hypothetical protein
MRRTDIAYYGNPGAAVADVGRVSAGSRRDVGEQRSGLQSQRRRNRLRPRQRNLVSTTAHRLAKSIPN